jgi:L-rhamnose-H+ transport protein
MAPNPFLGVLLHSIGGLAAGSFYVPYRKVRGWAWESFWLAGGVFSWIIAPWMVALIAAPDTLAILREAPTQSLLWAFIFGLLWGVGGLTFGLSMRYLGIALGYAVALGFCAAFGTLMIPLYGGKFGHLLTTGSGRTVLAGVAVCLLGIAVSGMAGRSKEREMAEDQKRSTIREFNFPKGLGVAIFAGILSACMSYGFEAGKPIAAIAIKHGTRPLWQNTPVFLVIVAGGFVTNFVWCAFLATRNHTWSNYISARTPLLANYLLCALAGTTWYFQFMFYGMGTTKMGRLNFSSWSLHLAAIIIFSTLWGIGLREWRGSSRRTHLLVAGGLAVLILSMFVVGYGNYLDTLGPH